MNELCSEYLSVRYIWLYVLMCSVLTYAFQSESTLYSWLNVKEPLAPSRCEIWSLSDWNWTRTQNHLVCKRRLSHFCLRTRWFWVRVQLQSGIRPTSSNKLLLLLTILSHFYCSELYKLFHKRNSQYYLKF